MLELRSCATALERPTPAFYGAGAAGLGNPWGRCGGRWRVTISTQMNKQRANTLAKIQRGSRPRREHYYRNRKRRFSYALRARVTTIT